MSLSDTGSSPDLPDPLVGQVFAEKYKILGVIARGGMGRIYRAEQMPLARTVAVKVLAPRHDTADDPEFHRRFLREAGALARLRHPNTVAVFDYGHVPDQDLFFMVMEFVDGQPLSTAIKEQGPFPPVRALKIAYEIARSLGEAHGHGMVHRDLKPSNVMLVNGDEGESVKVLDFGIVKLVGEDDVELTRADRLVGSPRYMAPEQIRHTEVDGRTDLYAIGVLLFEMMTGRPLFRANTAMGTLLQHLQEPVPTFASRDADVPAAVEKLVRRLLEKEPAMRPADVEAFKLECRTVLGALGERQSATASGTSRPPASPGGLGRVSAPASAEVTVPTASNPTLALATDTPAPVVTPPRVRSATLLVAAGVLAMLLGVPLLWWSLGQRPVAPTPEAPIERTPAPEPADAGDAAPEPPPPTFTPPAPAAATPRPATRTEPAPRTDPARPAPERRAPEKPPAPKKSDDLDILMER